MKIGQMAAYATQANRFAATVAEGRAASAGPQPLEKTFRAARDAVEAKQADTAKGYTQAARERDATRDSTEALGRAKEAVQKLQDETVTDADREKYQKQFSEAMAAAGKAGEAQSANKADATARIAAIAEGGGTNIHPGMTEARAALGRTNARIKHMIVLTDGQTNGSGYPELAAACKAERTTVSTVAVGGDADVGLLQSIAASGGGKFYLSVEPGQVVRIFTRTGEPVADCLRRAGFAATEFDGMGRDGPISLVFVQTQRRKVRDVTELARAADPECYYTVEDIRQAADVAETRRQARRDKELAARNTPTTLASLFDDIEESKKKELRLVVKTDAAGSLEVVTKSLRELAHDEVRVNIIHSGVGCVTTSDVSLAEIGRASCRERV